MSHASHELVRNIEIKITKEGLKEYFGTSKCTSVLKATVYEEYFKVLGSTLIANGGCPVLLNADDFYLFEANEVEVL